MTALALTRRQKVYPINSEPFWHWINERHAIYLRRAAGLPAPWTTDPVMQKYKFTNVFRELDRVTIWIRENIREPYADHPDLWLMLALARFVNYPPALEEVMDPALWPPGNPDLPEIAKILEARRAAGKQTETGAYMIRAENDATAPWYDWPKQRYVVEIVIGGMWRDQARIVPALKTSISEGTEALTKVHGCGGFLAYEIATDLRHCSGWLDRAPDIMNWANPGPGARRGLNSVYGRPLKDTCGLAVHEMRKLLEMAPIYLASHVPDLEMRDVEHSLCETFKWLRGSSRSLFKPS